MNELPKHIIEAAGITPDEMMHHPEFGLMLSAYGTMKLTKLFPDAAGTLSVREQVAQAMTGAAKKRSGKTS